MKETNGSHAGDQQHDERPDLFGSRIELERSAPMAGFARVEGAAAKRLLEIEKRMETWDWREEAAAGAASNAGQGRGRGKRNRPTDGRRSPNRMWLIVVAGVVALGAVGGIVWTTTGSGRPAAPSLSPAVTEFKAADRAATKAGLQLATGFSDLKGVPTITAVSQFTDPYATALGSYLHRLERISWSSSQIASSRALQTQLRTFITFLHTIHTISGVGLGAWIREVYTNVATLTYAQAQVRRGLGLPQTPTT
jgi:hypothetical protein